LRELREDHLNNEDHHPDSTEHSVVNDSSEDVFLIMNLSSIDHVKDLHENESSEDHSHVSGRPIVVIVLEVEFLRFKVIRSSRVDHTLVVGDVSFSLRDKVLSEENDTKHNDTLECRHSQDVLNHLSGNDVVIS